METKTKLFYIRKIIGEDVYPLNSLQDKTWMKAANHLLRLELWQLEEIVAVEGMAIIIKDIVESF